MDYNQAIWEAIALRKQEKRAEALGNLILLTISHPNEIHAFMEAGTTALEMGDVDFGLELFRRANEINDQSFWPYYYIAHFKHLAQDYAGAMACLERAAVRCKGVAAPHEYAVILKRYSDARSNLLGPLVDPLVSHLPGPTLPGRPLSNALRLSIVKDEEDIIYASLQSSYTSGIRYFAIADNASQDSTWAELMRFRQDHPDCIVYLASDPVAGHFQSAKTMGLVSFAMTILMAMGKNIEWIFPLDADEMIHTSGPDRDLYSLIEADASRTKNILVYRMVDFAANETIGRLPAGADIESLFPAFAKHRLNRLKKVAFRINPSAILEEGNHFCQSVASDISELIIGEEHGIVLKHYPIRSIHQLRNKIINGGAAYENVPNSVNLGLHWKLNYERYLAEGENYLIEKIKSHYEENN